MEQEHFLTGYCRTADQSRMVAVITEDHKFVEADCLYENCPYATGCTIAKSIEELTKE